MCISFSDYFRCSVVSDFICLLETGLLMDYLFLSRPRNNIVFFCFSTLFDLFFGRGSSYHLFNNNCNTFSEDLAQFLCGTSIPKYILDLPHEVLSTPFGQALAPLVRK